MLCSLENTQSKQIKWKKHLPWCDVGSYNSEIILLALITKYLSYVMLPESFFFNSSESIWQTFTSIGDVQVNELYHNTDIEEREIKELKHLYNLSFRQMYNNCRVNHLIWLFTPKYKTRGKVLLEWMLTPRMTNGSFLAMKQQENVIILLAILLH